jgi:hypothetical protein
MVDINFQPMWRRSVAPHVSKLGLVAVLVVGCEYDDAHRCGEAMHFNEVASVCECDSNAVAVTGGCQVCRKDQVVADGKCACPPDFKENDKGICVEVPKGLGTPCNESTPCVDDTYNYCAPNPQGDGYCTNKGCATQEDCGASYTCTLWDAEPYCRRAPTGEGATCADNTACADFEANMCVKLIKQCVVAGCDVVKNDCSATRECCDVSSLGFPGTTICVPAGSCPTKSK